MVHSSTSAHMSGVYLLIIASCLLVLIATPMLKSFIIEWECVPLLWIHQLFQLENNIYNARNGDGSARSQQGSEEKQWSVKHFCTKFGCSYHMIDDTGTGRGNTYFPLKPWFLNSVLSYYSYVRSKTSLVLCFFRSCVVLKKPMCIICISCFADNNFVRPHFPHYIMSKCWLSKVRYQCGYWAQQGRLI